MPSPSRRISCCFPCTRWKVFWLLILIIFLFRIQWTLLKRLSYQYLPTLTNNPLSSSNTPLPQVIFCVLAKNNHILVREFIAFHLALGVTTFELYDNDSNPPLYSVLNGLGNQHIQYHNWSDTIGNWNKDNSRTQMQGHQTLQDAAYQQCLSKYAGKPNIYVTPIDIDEFLFPCRRSSSNTIDDKLLLPTLVQYSDIWGLQCAKYGPTDAPPRIAGETTIERNLYRNPVFNYWYKEYDIIEFLAWLTRFFHPACQDKDNGYILCEETTPTKYIYKTSRISSSLANTVGTHGFSVWPDDLDYERKQDSKQTTRYSYLCCNHYFWRTTKDTLAKAERNHNQEYLARLKDQGIMAWHLTIHDPIAVSYVQGMKTLLHAHPIPKEIQEQLNTDEGG